MAHRRKLLTGGCVRKGIVGILVVLALLVVARIICTYWVCCVSVVNDTMAPTIPKHSMVLVNKRAYTRQPPERRDIVMFYPPDTPVGMAFIQRVVACGGDEVLIRDGHLYVNDMDSPIREPYIEEPMRYELSVRGKPYHVPGGHLFVLGDNRNDSKDSHLFGPVPDEKVIGKVIGVWQP